VGDKIFALASLDGPFTINLKCDPEKAIELRERYPSIKPGYHMNKQHWNTIEMDGSLPPKLVKEMIDHSYNLIYNKLPQSVKLRLG
jgi:predicted DNA-binding protein (MmcQ/YjbR family)